jgi:2-phosphoglycerate kinase
MLGISYNIPNIIKEKDMENNKTFYIVYYSNKDKKHITRRGKHDEKSRYGTSKKGVPYYVYYDLDAHGYRTATASWKVRT